MMTRAYYACWYRLDGRDAYIIWFTNSTDGVFVTNSGHVPSFQTIDQVQHYLVSANLPFKAEAPILHDLDGTAVWLQRPLSTTVPCNLLLAAWNLFTDVSTSVGDAFDSDQARTRTVYNKLFWGSNLPSVTPEGQEYRPDWTDDERLLIQEVVADGLRLFRHVVRPAEYTHVSGRDGNE